MLKFNYQENVKKAIELFNKICTDQKSKLEFIKETYETDGAANMNYSLDELNKIMELIVAQSFNKPSEPKNFFYKNLKRISKCDSPEDIILLFKSEQQIIDEFCVSYLTFKQCFDFVDEEKATLIKIQNAIAKKVIEFVFGV